MSSLEEQLLIKEEELRVLACQLSEIMKDFSSKQCFIQEATKKIPLLEKKIKRKGEMAAQEQKDNEIISSRIKSLESILKGKLDSAKDPYTKFYKQLHKTEGNQDLEEFRNTEFNPQPLVQSEIKLSQNSKSSD